MVKIRKLNHIKAYVLLFYFSFLERKYLRNKYKDTSFPFEHNYNTESIIFEDTNFKVPPPHKKVWICFIHQSSYIWYGNQIFLLGLIYKCRGEFDGNSYSIIDNTFPL